PDRNRFHKRTGGEIASAHSSHTFAFNHGVVWISDAGSKDPFLRRIDGVETHEVIPDSLWVSMHDEESLQLVKRGLRLFALFYSHDSRNKEDVRGDAVQRSFWR